MHERNGHSAPPLTLASPGAWRRAGYLLTNPFQNFLLPAGVLRRVLALGQSPLINESLARPGGWRAMEIIYRNEGPVGLFDRLALRNNPLSIAARNRRIVVTRILCDLIAQYGSNSRKVTMVGVGAGPGRHAIEAIAASAVDHSRVSAVLMDFDSDAFEYGRAVARSYGVESSVQFLQGDARRIRETLPDLTPQIVKIVGLAEYLTDEQFLELLQAMHAAMPPGGSLVTHGLVDAFQTRRFLARVFGLRHRQRSANAMEALLRKAGFIPDECVVEPTGIHPILVARREA